MDAYFCCTLDIKEVINTKGLERCITQSSLPTGSSNIRDFAVKILVSVVERKSYALLQQPLSQFQVALSFLFHV